MRTARYPPSLRRQCRKNYTEPVSAPGLLRSQHIAISPKSSRAALANIIRLAASCILLYVLWRSLETPADVSGVLQGLDLTAFSAAVVIFALGQVGTALRMRCLMATLHRPITCLEAIRIHFSGLAFGCVLPTGMGGDVAKVVMLRHAGGTLRSVRAVLSGRVVGLLALLLSIVLTAPAIPRVFPRPALMLTLVAGSGIALAATYFFAAATRSRWRAMPRWLALLRLLLVDLRRMQRRPQFLAIVLLSMAIVASVIVTFSLLSKSVGADIPASFHLLAVPPIILAMHVPLSYGGWGIRESAAAAVFATAGLDAGTGFILSALYGITIVVVAIPSVLLWLAGIRRGLTTPGAPPVEAKTDP